MSTVLRRNRKGTDEQIIRLNSLGLTLATISKMLGCHPSSVSLRLSSLNIPPADTRHSFMEAIYKELPNQYQELLADLLEKEEIPSVRDYVKSLIVRDVDSKTPTTQGTED